MNSPNDSLILSPLPGRREVLVEDCISPSFDDDCMVPPIEFDNDCRHPDPPPPDWPALPGAYIQPAGAFTAPLPHGFHLAHSPFAAGPAALSPAAWARYRRFQRPALLYDDTDRRLARLALLHPLAGPPVACAAPAGTLVAWLHISNACNLECPYCYVRKSSAHMSPDTGRRAVAAVFRSAAEHGFRQVTLKYAGGEATLHFALIRRLHEEATRLAALTGINMRAIILSNGVRLKPTDADWLVEQHVKLMISIDGVGALHNRLRPMRRRPNDDTFAAVENTVDHVLLPRGIRPDISMTVTGLNAHGAADVARWALLDRGLPTGFSFYRPTPLSRGREELAIEEERLISGMSAAYDAIEADLPTQPFTAGLLDRTATQAHQHACGVGRNYLVITHEGALAQCQMHLGTPVQPDLSGDLLGVVAAGPVHNLPVAKKEGCRDCAFRHQCAGGCPLETFRATGRWDVRSPNCNLYTALLPRVWRLEGLRLMKSHGYLS